MEKSDWLDEYVEMVRDCEQRSEDLSDWETTFIDSLSRQLDDEKVPSAKQVSKLSDIWDRVTK